MPVVLEVIFFFSSTSKFMQRNCTFLRSYSFFCSVPVLSHYKEEKHFSPEFSI